MQEGYKKRKIGIIGVGHVGSHVAAMLLARHLCEELVLLDRDRKVLSGQTLDLADMAFYLGDRCRVTAGDYRDVKDADILIISVGGKFFDENRLEELDDSMEIIDEIAPRIEASGFCGIAIVITNPCDLVAYYLDKKISASVIGSGTALDSARFVCRIARGMDVCAASIQGWCVGEHGDSQVPVWSQVCIGGNSLEEIRDKNTEVYQRIQKKQIEKSTIFAGWEIADAKGSTEFGIGIAASELVKSILKDENRILPCSVMLTGEYGERDVYASVPCILGAQGVKRVWNIRLNTEEQQAFHQSCQLLRNYIRTKIEPRL